MNKRIRNKKLKQVQDQKPNLQTAWNVVAEHLKKDGDISYFIDGPQFTKSGEYEIYCVSPDRVIIESSLKNKDSETNE